MARDRLEPSSRTQDLPPIIQQDGTEFPRSLAEEKLRRTSSARNTLIEEHTAAFRWLMASFLALNGGGLLALPGLEIDSTTFAISGGSFLVGTLSALGLGWRSQVINRIAIKKLEAIELVWAAALAVHQLDTLKAQKVDEEFTTVSSWSARVFSWASVTAFSLGVLSIGFGLQ